MFGLICRAIKNCRVFCVLDNRTREILLACILANVATINDINDNDYQSIEENHNYCLSTRICIDFGVHIDLMISKNSAIICIGLIIKFF